MANTDPAVIVDGNAFYEPDYPYSLPDDLPEDFVYPPDADDEPSPDDWCDCPFCLAGDGPNFCIGWQISRPARC